MPRFPWCARRVVVIAIALAVLGASQARAEEGKDLSCPCLFDASFWTQAAFLKELNSNARADEACSNTTLNRSTHKTLSLTGSKPLSLAVTFEVAHDTGTAGFKADSFCKVWWIVKHSSGEGAAITFDEQVVFDVTHYEVIADPTSPYKELMSAIPSAQASPLSIQTCETELRKIAQSYKVNCEFD